MPPTNLGKRNCKVCDSNITDSTYSNLMRTMVGKIKFQWQDGSPILPAGLFADIGNLTFNQLASLRHRGAFSTVSLTFSRCCQLAQHQSREEKEAINLLEQWYQVGNDSDSRHI